MPRPKTDRHKASQLAAHASATVVTMAGVDRQAPRDGLHLMRTIDLMVLSDDELAALAISTAQSGVRVLEAAGVDPGDALRAQAAGDPERVAAYVAEYRRSPADAA
jgi:hypothetical protein